MGSGGSNRMLSAEETAEMIGKALSTFYKNWKSWGLEGYRVGRELKFRERNVETWLQRQRVKLGLDSAHLSWSDRSAALYGTC